MLALGVAHADPTDNKALADQLFKQGRDLGKANKWEEACPKFEASLRYDGALGTRLNLATCYEKIGKLASAWGQFRDAAELASKAGDKKRETYALQQAQALEPKLPKLTITAPKTATAGLAVTRDGEIIAPGALGTSLYVDPGEHRVVATAPGFQDFSQMITIAPGEAKTVDIPELQKVGAAPPDLAKPNLPPPPDKPRAAPAPHDEPAVSHTRKYVGLTLAAVGLAATGAGLYVGSQASAKYDAAKKVCPNLTCDDMFLVEGQNDVSQARSKATTSTILVIGGGAALAAGVVLWLTAPSAESPHVGASVTASSAAISWSGRW